MAETGNMNKIIYFADRQTDRQTDRNPLKNISCSCIYK